MLQQSTKHDVVSSMLHLHLTNPPPHDMTGFRRGFLLAWRRHTGRALVEIVARCGAPHLPCKPASSLTLQNAVYTYVTSMMFVSRLRDAFIRPGQLWVAQANRSILRANETKPIPNEFEDMDTFVRFLVPESES